MDRGNILKKDAKQEMRSTENNHVEDDAVNQSDFEDFTTLPQTVLKWIEANSTNTFLIWDDSGYIAYSSQTVTSLLGYTPKEMLGKKWDEMVSAEDAAFFYKSSNIYTIFSQPFTVPVLNENGKYIWCECVAKRMVLENGDRYYVAILRDISDKKEIEEMMIRSEKMSIAGQLSAGIAHEIRNPLTSLKGFLQLLQAGVSHKEEYYKIMIDEIEKMESISSELLFISKPLTENKEMEDVGRMIEDVVVLLRPQASLNECHIIWDEVEQQKIYCDRSQIKQVLINLVKNAYEAMEQGGHIEINVTDNDDTISIKVIDEGPGVPEEIVHKLGEPFFTTKQNGTGLGLMIANQILERHDGKLEIYRNEVKGTTFQMTLPKYK